MTNADITAASAAPREGRQAPNAWRVLVLLAMANVLNFYDRTIPAILVEEIKKEFGLNDTQIGFLSGIFIVVYAVAGVALGRMADRGSRRRIMGIGLIVWSVMTALSGGVWSFASLLLVRLGVGIGEASYAPAANSTIADLFPVSKRARAVAIFQLGIPVGLILAFFTTGAIVDAFDSWRAPFFIAAVPGLVLAVALLRMDEPDRGASEVVRMDAADGAASRALSIPDAVRAVWTIRTMRWLILSGVGVQLAAYSVSTFLVPLFQRYHGLSLTGAGISAGVVLGFTGLVGLFLGGWAADRASRRSLRSRVVVGAIALGVASPLSLLAFTLGPDALGLFISVMSVAWLLQFFFHTPRCRPCRTSWSRHCARRRSPSSSRCSTCSVVRSARSSRACSPMSWLPGTSPVVSPPRLTVFAWRFSSLPRSRCCSPRSVSWGRPGTLSGTMGWCSPGPPEASVSRLTARHWTPRGWQSRVKSLGVVYDGDSSFVVGQALIAPAGGVSSSGSVVMRVSRLLARTSSPR
jgi:MFS family permease